MKASHFTITIASLNSLRDLALDFIIVFIYFSLPGGKYIKQERGNSVYGNSRWPKHTRKHVVKKKYHGQSQTSQSDGISFLRGSLSLLKNSR